MLAPGMAADMFHAAAVELEGAGVLVRTTDHQGDTLAINPDALELYADTAYIATPQGKRRLTVPSSAAEALRGMPCIDATEELYEDVLPTVAAGANMLNFSRFENVHGLWGAVDGFLGNPRLVGNFLQSSI